MITSSCSPQRLGILISSDAAVSAQKTPSNGGIGQPLFARSSRIVCGIGTLAAKPGCRARPQARSLGASLDDQCNKPLQPIAHKTHSSVNRPLSQVCSVTTLHAGVLQYCRNILCLRVTCPLLIISVSTPAEQQGGRLHTRS
jgi:hypothetical protein